MARKIANLSKLDTEPDQNLRYGYNDWLFLEQEPSDRILRTPGETLRPFRMLGIKLNDFVLWEKIA